MYKKYLITAELRVLTGLHIGGSNVFSAIGAVDSPVVRDPLTNMPIIPGSSLKGKLRTLLFRSFNNSAIAEKGKQHDDDPEFIRRLFGCSKPVWPSRLQFADARLANEKCFGEIGVTEVKFENTIDRVTAVANPRQIERVNAGALFDVKIVYDAENEAEVMEDMANLAKAMKLLQLDYLGGHGSRGSGRVSFENINVSVAYPFDSNESCDEINELFAKVQEYELLSV